MDANMTAFALCVGVTWMNGAFPLWSQFDNTGPRTTSTLGVSHSSVRTTLDWLQRYQFDIQCGCMQLSQREDHRNNDEPRMSTLTRTFRLKYSLELGQLFFLCIC